MMSNGLPPPLPPPPRPTSGMGNNNHATTSPRLGGAGASQSRPRPAFVADVRRTKTLRAHVHDASPIPTESASSRRGSVVSLLGREVENGLDVDDIAAGGNDDLEFHFEVPNVSRRASLAVAATVRQGEGDGAPKSAPSIPSSSPAVQRKGGSPCMLQEGATVRSAVAVQGSGGEESLVDMPGRGISPPMWVVGMKRESSGVANLPKLSEALSPASSTSSQANKIGPFQFPVPVHDPAVAARQAQAVLLAAAANAFSATVNAAAAAGAKKGADTRSNGERSCSPNGNVRAAANLFNAVHYARRVPWFRSPIVDTSCGILQPQARIAVAHAKATEAGLSVLDDAAAAAASSSSSKLLLSDAKQLFLPSYSQDTLLGRGETAEASSGRDGHSSVVASMEGVTGSGAEAHGDGARSHGSTAHRPLADMQDVLWQARPAGTVVTSHAESLRAAAGAAAEAAAEVAGRAPSAALNAQDGMINRDLVLHEIRLANKDSRREILRESKKISKMEHEVQQKPEPKHITKDIVRCKPITEDDSRLKCLTDWTPTAEEILVEQGQRAEDDGCIQWDTVTSAVSGKVYKVSHVYSPSEREHRVCAFKRRRREMRQNLREGALRFPVRKQFAEKRERVGGRFVKKKKTRPSAVS